MQDGEEILGAYCWRNIEHIEDLSMVYWNLRRLNGEELKLAEQVEEAGVAVADAQKQKATYLERSKGLGDEFPEERNFLLESIEEVNRERDALRVEATRLKNRHSALKMKVKVLQKEGGDQDSEIEETQNKLASLREAFAPKKKRMQTLNKELAAFNKQLDEIQEKMDLKASASNDELTDAYEQISRANRNITKYKAALGLLQEEQAVLFGEVGRFLNINSKRKDCQEACKEHSLLQEQVALLYKSAEFNRKLVEKLGG